MVLNFNKQVFFQTEEEEEEVVVEVDVPIQIDSQQNRNIQSIKGPKNCLIYDTTLRGMCFFLNHDYFFLV